MHEANILYFDLRGNEWFFLQKIQDRQYDILVAKSPTGIIGIGQTGDVLSLVEEMGRQRMMLFSVNLQPPREENFQKLSDIGVLGETIAGYIIRIFHIEPGDAFEIEKQGNRCFVVSGLSALEKLRMNGPSQPHLVTQDRSRCFGIFGKDFDAGQADFRKYAF